MRQARAVPRGLGAVAAGRHRAPGTGDVPRAVVEGPAAAVAAAGLEALPLAGRHGLVDGRYQQPEPAVEALGDRLQPRAATTAKPGAQTAVDGGPVERGQV